MPPTRCDPDNQVHLASKVSGAPQARTLPSGDPLVTFRVAVRRPTTPDGSTRVDTIDVACWTAATRRRAEGLDDGQAVEVDGALRRRFWRTPVGAASRTEIEAVRIGVRPQTAVK